MNNEQHIPFDLEWAKRGGITKTKESSSSKSYLCRFVRSDGRTCLIATVRMKHSSDGNFTAHPTEKLIEWTYKDVVMATREECEAAGIEYIDRPNTSAKNTDPYTPANAVPPKTDTERLEHCFKYFIGRMGQKANINPAGTWYDSPREAIDAAMAAGKGGE